MNSHKERLKTMSTSSLPRVRHRHSSARQSKRSTAPLTDNEERPRRSKSEHTNSDEDTASIDRQDPVYLNVHKSDDDEVDDAEYPLNHKEKNNYANTKSLDRLNNHNSQSRPTMKSNGNRHYVTMGNNSTLNVLSTNQIYKSRSLQALKAKETSKTLNKSSIQQEYHDKKVQEYFRGVTYGKARKPCQIATAMFVLFGVFFLTGLVIIGLTYLYQNIMPSLDVGEAVGPVLLACSFIFLGVGIKFIYDAHKISRQERRKIVYKGYDRTYVGVHNKNHVPKQANEKLVSGSTSNKGLTRIPNRINTLPTTGTFGRSSQKVNTRTDDASYV